MSKKSPSDGKEILAEIQRGIIRPLNISFGLVQRLIQRSVTPIKQARAMTKRNRLREWSSETSRWQINQTQDKTPIWPNCCNFQTGHKELSGETSCRWHLLNRKTCTQRGFLGFSIHTKTEPKAMDWQRTFVASHVPLIVGRLITMERFPAQDLNPMSRLLPGGFAFKPPGEFVSWVSFSPTSNGPQETEGWLFQVSQGVYAGPGSIFLGDSANRIGD